MKKIFAVIKREYLQIVKTKGFIISTVLAPVIMIAFIAVPVLLSVKSTGEKKTIAVVDMTGQVFQEFDRTLAEYKMKDESRRYTVQEFRPTADISGLRSLLSQKVLANEFSAYIFIPDSILSGGETEFVSQHVSDFDEIKRLSESLNRVVVGLRLKKEGLDPQRVSDYMKHVGLKTIKVTPQGEKEDVGGTFAMAYVLVLLIYMTLIFYGSIILRGVIEEKSNRVVEVVLSSLKPFELMMGKILGIGAVGLTQYAVWALIGFVMSQYGMSMVTSLVPAASGIKFAIPPYIFFYFVVFFILGYFLYGTLYAAVASTVNNEKEAQQMLMPITMFLVLPILLMTMVIKDPSGSTSVILSLIPFFAPIIMFMRICVLMPPAWQVALSIGLLGLTVVAMVWLAAKIYRIGILMYGKKPSLPEIVKWIKYS
jgi:ABC-2 type transport system permease protein